MQGHMLISQPSNSMGRVEWQYFAAFNDINMGEGLAIFSAGSFVDSYPSS